VEALGNNYMRVTLLSHVFTFPLRLLFCDFGFLNGSIEFSLTVPSYMVKHFKRANAGNVMNYLNQL
jgi:hypothetical protein